MADVDVVVNPYAGNVRPGTAWRRRILDEAASCGARLHEPTNLEQLDQLARDFASRESKTPVLFVGGDGTFMRGLSALARAFGDAPLPVLGLVPAGTVGTVARNFGLRGAGCARRVIRTACSKSVGATSGLRTDPHLTLRVCDDSGSAYIGFIFGAGLVGRFFDVYQRAPRRGLLTAATIAARVFAGSFVRSTFANQVLAPIRGSIDVDGNAHGGQAWSLIVASVVRDLGLHFLVTYRAADANRFHVVASGLPPRLLGPQMPRVLRGRPLRGEPLVDTLARSLIVRFAERDAYVLDGDVIRAQSVTVEAGPVVHLIRP